MVRGSSIIQQLNKPQFFCNGSQGVFAKGTEMARLLFRGDTYFFYKKAIKDMHDLPEYLYNQWQDLNANEEVEITQETFVYFNWKFRGNMYKEIKSVQDAVAHLN